MSMRRGDMGVSGQQSWDSHNPITADMYNETLRCNPHERPSKRPSNGDTAPKSHPFPLQPINGLKVLDRPRPARGGLVVVEMLLQAVARVSTAATTDVGGDKPVAAESESAKWFCGKNCTGG